MSISIIEKKLAQLRGHIRMTFLSWGVAKVVIWASLLVLWLYYSDKILQLPGGVRLAFLLGGIGVLLVVAVRNLFYPLSRTLTDEDLALLVEREYPLLNDRLISALQILRANERYKDTASEDMIKVLLGEAFDLAGKLRFEQAVRTRKLLGVLGMSVLAMGLVFGHAWLDRDDMSIWARRALGGGPQWPTRTQLDARILEKDELPRYPSDESLNVNFSFAAAELVEEPSVRGVYEVASGSDLRFVAEPSGDIPSSAEIRIVTYGREFVIGLVIDFFISFIFFGFMALLPQILQRQMGFPVLETGFVLMYRGVGTMIASLLSGFLLLRFKPRPLIVIGILAITASNWVLAGITPDTDTFPIILAILMQGFGIGFMSTPTEAAAFNTLPPSLRPDAASVMTAVRRIAAGIGVSILIAQLVDKTQTARAALMENVSHFSEDFRNFPMPESWNPDNLQGMLSLERVVGKQAEFMAYLFDFELMTFITLGALPLLLFLRTRREEE
jgi:MFS family permease